MSLKQRREEFEKTNSRKEGRILTFHGAEGYDVYNCSIPFDDQGHRCMYGRTEKREEWARSMTLLFECVGPDEWVRVQDIKYPIEDPNITVIGGKLILNGTFTVYRSGRLDGYYALFYRGTDSKDMYYFATGPYNMKDIRLVELPDHRIGVFSRPRNDEIVRLYGSESQIGFTVIDDLNELTEEAISNAAYIPGLFSEGEWGGCNQAYLLDSGYIGVIGHKSYQSGQNERDILHSYINIAFVFDPVRHRILEERILATSASYPAFPAKESRLRDCCFTSGIVMREDGKADLYSGLGDTVEGRIVIDDPFEGYGKMVPFGTIG
jgi:hypothetical protein